MVTRIRVQGDVRCMQMDRWGVRDTCNRDKFYPLDIFWANIF